MTLEYPHGVTTQKTNIDISKVFLVRNPLEKCIKIESLPSTSLQIHYSLSSFHSMWCNLLGWITAVNERGNNLPQHLPWGTWTELNHENFRENIQLASRGPPEYETGKLLKHYLELCCIRWRIQKSVYCCYSCGQGPMNSTSLTLILKVVPVTCDSHSSTLVHDCTLHIADK
jgi:hypothetical protein